MLQRGNDIADRLVSFFELSNTIPDLKRRLFISLGLLGIFILVLDSALASFLDLNAFNLVANLGMILFLMLIIWLLWRHRERQELILLVGFVGSALFLLLNMYQGLRLPAQLVGASLMDAASPWFLWFILLYMVCFFTFRPVTALRLCLIISVLATLLLLASILRLSMLNLLVLHDFVLLFLANILVILMAFPLAQAQEKNSQTDFLTGLANRNRGYNALSNEIERTQRYGEIFSLILFDIDHFKKINDAQGHPSGDTVLREVAAFVDQHLRRTDLICRWGGEEFLVLMPHTDLASARLKADHLRQQINNHPFNKSLKLTASFGVTAYYPFDSASTMLERADRALYRAKRNGRNLVEVE